jgi:predicted RNA-binding Zn ribbon-like protein
VTFDSHVMTLADVAARLVNRLTPGHDRGRVITAPPLPQAAGEALGGEGRPTPAVTRKQAAALADAAAEMRKVFTAPGSAEAARTVNALMAGAGARPQLDPEPGGGWHVHFHGVDDTLATGWIAGCATALALALGSSLAGRLGVCDADLCDRVYVDTSRNSSKRFCSLACQNRVKAAAHRARAQL